MFKSLGSSTIHFYLQFFFPRCPHSRVVFEVLFPVVSYEEASCGWVPYRPPTCQNPATEKELKLIDK